MRRTVSAPPSRRRARLLAPLLVVVAISAFPACSRSKHSDDEPSSSATTRPLPQPSAELTLKAGRRVVESAGPEVPFDPKMARAVTRVANAYVQTGVLDPLVKGETGDEFESLFGIGVRAEVQDGEPDREALTEEVSPQATGKARSLGSKLDLTALADQGGQVVMVTGRVAFRINVPTEQGKLTINRVGDLVFQPVGGDWLISGYSMLTTRDLGGERTTSSTTSDTPTTTTMGEAP